MLSEERREIISELLKEFGSVSIKDLSLKFGLSVATIRRDLDMLADKKLLKRTFGGAISQKIIKRELNFETKKDVNIEQKKMIALIASKYVEDGDTIFIESGSTCIQLCFNLSNKNKLTIITNSPDIAIAANMANKESTIFLTGGLFKSDTHSLTGHLADENLKYFNFEKAFIGITAIDLKEGITTVDYQEAYTKKTIIDSAQKVIGLVDNSKFGKICLNSVCPVSSLDILITDDKVSFDAIEKIRQMGVIVINKI